DRHRVLHGIELLETPIARRAFAATIRLAKVLDERAMAAAGARGVALHVAQQRPRALAPFAVGLEHLPPAHEVAARIDQHALRRRASASTSRRDEEYTMPACCSGRPRMSSSCRCRWPRRSTR